MHIQPTVPIQPPVPFASTESGEVVFQLEWAGPEKISCLDTSMGKLLLELDRVRSKLGLSVAAHSAKVADRSLVEAVRQLHSHLSSDHTQNPREVYEGTQDSWGLRNIAAGDEYVDIKLKVICSWDKSLYKDPKVKVQPKDKPPHPLTRPASAPNPFWFHHKSNGNEDPGSHSNQKGRSTTPEKLATTKVKEKPKPKYAYEKNPPAVTKPIKVVVSHPPFS